jgi:hypothetical protein
MRSATAVAIAMIFVVLATILWFIGLFRLVMAYPELILAGFAVIFVWFCATELMNKRNTN